MLTAADYGDPTTRRRLFILAERRRRPRWPQPTHAPRGTAAARGLAAWRGAREIVDWSLEGQSIFDRKKPLAPATLKRIEAGLRKFGGWHAEPFIVVLRNHSTARALDEPAPTITTSGAHLALCQPFLLGQQSGAAARTIDEPAPTVATGGAISLVEPFMFANRTRNAPRLMNEPIPALCTGNHIALVEPHLRHRDSAGREHGRNGARKGGVEVRIDGRPCQLDIRFRMLAPHELAQAQGFDRDHEFMGNRTEQVRQIGNAVPVATAHALCEAMLG